MFEELSSLFDLDQMTVEARLPGLLLDLQKCFRADLESPTLRKLNADDVNSRFACFEYIIVQLGAPFGTCGLRDELLETFENSPSSIPFMRHFISHVRQRVEQEKSVVRGTTKWRSR